MPISVLINDLRAQAICVQLNAAGLETPDKCLRASARLVMTEHKIPLWDDLEKRVQRVLWTMVKRNGGVYRGAYKEWEARVA